jgi:hypothetical protein
VAGRWAIGPQQEVPEHRLDQAYSRFVALCDAARWARTHLWIASLGYLVAVPLTNSSILDVDNLVIPPQIGCFICEQPYERGAETTACPGDPEEQP